MDGAGLCLENQEGCHMKLRMRSKTASLHWRAWVMGASAPTQEG